MFGRLSLSLSRENIPLQLILQSASGDLELHAVDPPSRYPHVLCVRNKKCDLEISFLLFFYGLSMVSGMGNGCIWAGRSYCLVFSPPAFFPTCVSRYTTGRFLMDGWMDGRNEMGWIFEIMLREYDLIFWWKTKLAFFFNLTPFSFILHIPASGFFALPWLFSAGLVLLPLAFLFPCSLLASGLSLLTTASAPATTTTPLDLRDLGEAGCWGCEGRCSGVAATANATAAAAAAGNGNGNWDTNGTGKVLRRRKGKTRSRGTNWLGFCCFCFCEMFLRCLRDGFYGFCVLCIVFLLRLRESLVWAFVHACVRACGPACERIIHLRSGAFVFPSLLFSPLFLSFPFPPFLLGFGRELGIGNGEIGRG